MNQISPPPKKKNYGMFVLSDGEEIMALALFVLIQCRSVTDGRTDRHRCSSNTSASVGCFSTALVISLTSRRIMKVDEVDGYG